MAVTTIEVKNLEDEKVFGQPYKNLYILNENSEGQLVINGNYSIDISEIDLLEDANIKKLKWKLDSLGTLILLLSDAYLKLRKMKVVTVDVLPEQKTSETSFSINGTTPHHTTFTGEAGKIRKILSIIILGENLAMNDLSIAVDYILDSKSAQLYHYQFDTNGIQDLNWVNGWCNVSVTTTSPNVGDKEELLDFIRNVQLLNSNTAIKVSVYTSDSAGAGDFTVTIIYEEREMIT